MVPTIASNTPQFEEYVDLYFVVIHPSNDVLYRCKIQGYRDNSWPPRKTSNMELSNWSNVPTSMWTGLTQNTHKWSKMKGTKDLFN